MGRGFFLAPAHVFHQLVCDLGQVTTPRAQFPICKMELLPSPWRAAVSNVGVGVTSSPLQPLTSSVPHPGETRRPTGTSSLFLWLP